MREVLKKENEDKSEEHKTSPKELPMAKVGII
jgi:hypothetical protein